MRPRRSVKCDGRTSREKISVFTYTLSDFGGGWYAFDHLKFHRSGRALAGSGRDFNGDGRSFDGEEKTRHQAEEESRPEEGISRGGPGGLPPAAVAAASG